MTYPCVSCLHIWEADTLPPSHEEGLPMLCSLLCVADMSGCSWCRFLHAEAVESKVPLVPHSNVLEWVLLQGEWLCCMQLAGGCPYYHCSKERSTCLWPSLSNSVAEEWHFLAAQVCVNMIFIMKCGLNHILSTRISCVDRLSWGFLRAFPVLSTGCLQHCNFLTLLLNHRDRCVMPHSWLHRHKRLFLGFRLRVENFLIASYF